MEDWFSGVYIKSITGSNAYRPDYERAVPHRHDFYYCIILDEGKLDMEVDVKKIALNGQTLFLSYPGQIHRIISAELKSGWFLAFDPSFLDEKLKDILDQFLSEIVLVALDQQQSKALSAFAGHLYRIYEDENQLFRQTIVQSLVTALCYQMSSMYLSIEHLKLTGYSDRSIEITKAFKQLLRRNFCSIKKPSVYAGKMNITTAHLNDCVKAVTGFSVTYHIQQEVVREAARLLYYADLTIKEVADALGFDDEKYFIRLFKKVNGMTPGTFRKHVR